MNQSTKEDDFEEPDILEFFFPKYKLWEKVIVLIFFLLFFLWVYATFFHNEKAPPQNGRAFCYFCFLCIFSKTTKSGLAKNIEE